MRDAFISVLAEIARIDKNVMLLTGDLGFGVLTEFAYEFPKQYLNVGVAEQNMTGIAAGLALEGKTVFTYSIGNFNTMRCLEQIRNDVCYHDLNVKIVSIGGGFCYGALGISHHATEDLAIMSSLPNLKVVAPADKMETKLATFEVYNNTGPFYLRLGRGGESELYSNPPKFIIGKSIPVFIGGDIAILSIGGILENVMKARLILFNEGIKTSVYSFHTLRPFDYDQIQKLINQVKLIVTVEEHLAKGGLGSRVSEILAGKYGDRPALLRIGLGDNFMSEVGDQNYLREQTGLAPYQIANSVKYEIKRNKI
ncbi:MAG: transketolase [Desulfobacterales bacterium]|nr:transketolase [Desulfobacterales bacterium]